MPKATLCMGEMRKRRTAQWAAPGGLALGSCDATIQHDKRDPSADARSSSFYFNAKLHAVSIITTALTGPVACPLLFLTLRHSLQIKTGNIWWKGTTNSTQTASAAVVLNLYKMGGEWVSSLGKLYVVKHSCVTWGVFNDYIMDNYMFRSVLAIFRLS